MILSKTTLVDAAEKILCGETFAFGKNWGGFLSVLDWLGGYPFEVANAERVFYFYRAHGFSLRRLETHGGGSGCKQFVFARN